MLETDADRRNMLLALGGRADIVVKDQQLLGLYSPEPLQMDFDEVRMSGYSHSLQCLSSDVRRYGIEIDDAVSVPDEGDFYVASIGNESGMALIALRKP